ncbi:hypothetical protein DRP44_03400 [candidate division TA06 bacterium]|uniref:CheC-like protein domain-containing protein n=1 Tax=candidate division TA06 bacterium TaxID=2250710 RepID=A0A660S8W6_UNCT6|nr:MAG: hypothetical protein DRP44_03400 [candidate division TA06 bacterium]
MDFINLESIQLDGIREIANIGSGHSASALSQIVGHKVMINVPEVKIIPVEKISTLWENPNEIITGILLDFLGDITGKTLLLFTKNDAKYMVDILLGRETSDAMLFGEMEQSSLKEIANIVVSAYLSALGTFLELMVIPSVPALVIDDAASVLTSAYLSGDTDNIDTVFCIKTQFEFVQGEKILEGYMLFLPDTDSLKTILKALHLD